MSFSVTDGIVGFSFDKYPNSSIADSKTKSKAVEYSKNESRCISHLIYRCPIKSYVAGKSVEIDNLKFNYMIDGVPIAVYVLRNLFGSDLKNIAVVGSKETRLIFEMAREAFASELIGKNVIFAEEGEELSLYNTIQKGREALKSINGLESRVVSLHAGDLPLDHDKNQIINDPDAEHNDFVINLNCREMIFSDGKNEFSTKDEFFKRNYYWKFKNINGFYSLFKEANVYLINPQKIDNNLIKFLTGTRKGGSLGLVGLIAQAIAKEPLRAPELLAYGILNGSPMHNIILQGIYKGLNLVTFKKFFNKKFVKKTSLSFLQGIGERITGGKVKVKADHKDFTRLADIDSLEDWRFYEELINYAKIEYSGLDYIYPYAEDIEKFKNEYGGELRRAIPMYHDFKAFINERFSRFGLFEPYPNSSLEFIGNKHNLDAAVYHLHEKLSLAQA